MAVPLIAVAAALGVKHFRSEASTAAQARLVLEGIRSSAFKQNGLEWQSIAEGKVGPNSLDAIEEGSASMHRGFRLLIEAGWGTYVHEVDHLLDIHTQAVREEFTLLAAGREEAASKIDEERVDRGNRRDPVAAASLPSQPPAGARQHPCARGSRTAGGGHEPHCSRPGV